MRTRYIFIISMMLAFCGNAPAQFWLEDIYKSTDNYYDIKARFDKHWETHDKTVKGCGYKQFMRWAEIVEPRVYPSGDLSLLTLTAKNYQEFLKSYRAPAGERSNMTASITWTAMGPMGSQPGTMPISGPPLMKVGRVNFISIDPTNTLNLWVGAPAGGLWKSTNGGISWTTNTDQLPVTGCSDLAIDPTNTNIMYLATGDAYGFSSNSIGVLKSIDGGQTWNTTGYTSPLTPALYIRRLIVNPVNPQIVMAAGNTGLFRSTDGGATWTQINTIWCHDVEFNLANPNIVYLTGASDVYISNNGGASFNLMGNNGVPTGTARTLIALTPADPNYVYLLATQPGGNFMGLYRSTNAGVTFSLMSTSPNIVLGAGYYNLALAVSPINKNEVSAGGISLSRSLDGGATWTFLCNGPGINSAHSDHHDLKYTPDGTLYSTNDGGVWRLPPNNATWVEISGTMNVSQIYRMGTSALTPGKWITGHQDNGSNIRTSSSSYIGTWPGDGMDCFYDRTNDNNVFASYQGGTMFRSVNGGATWTQTAVGINSGWNNPWKQDPVSANTIYLAFPGTFYRSTDLGVTWTQLTAPIGTTLLDFAVAPSNNQVIYTVVGVIKRSNNAGASWTTVNTGLPSNSVTPMRICVDPLNANKAWVVFSGYSAGNKVFATTNGGTSWTNVSGNLPNIPGNCIIYEPGSNDRIYVGMDAGVYYMDNSTNGNWVLYNSGLPNTPVRDFEISPATPGILYAATFGRGVYAVSLIGSPTPVSGFNSSATGTNCAGTSISFSDQSSNTPTAWSWSVAPANGANISSASAQNPNITFQSAGVYTISMQATNANGQGVAVSQTINIAAAPIISVSGSVQTICTGEAVSYIASGASTYTWSNGGGSSAPATYTPASSTQYTVTGSGNGCVSAKVVSVSVSPCTGLSNVMLRGQEFSVFPNPSKGRIYIRTSSELKQEIQVTVHDVTGRMVLKQPVNFDSSRLTSEINMEDLSHGTYFIILSLGSETSRTIRILKE